MSLVRCIRSFFLFSPCCAVKVGYFAQSDTLFHIFIILDLLTNHQPLIHPFEQNTQQLQSSWLLLFSTAWLIVPTPLFLRIWHLNVAY